ncbi:MAG: aminopeptidase P N-terminal domain-containing protein [Gemmatimonadaceae bacterium]|nr:aminopeptidase P N-terminal domain-containing protein [Gemmatimonadaceae bacterium]
MTSLPTDGVLLALGAREPRDNHLAFWQSQDFRYLTGFDEPDAALVMIRRGGEVRGLLFVPPRDPAMEVWTGARLGVEGASARTGLEGRDARTLDTTLDSILSSIGRGTLYAVGDFGDATGPQTPDDQLLAQLRARHPSLSVRDATASVLRLRSVKSAAEQELLRTAAAISAAAHRDVLGSIGPGRNEYEVEALAEFTFRRQGADGPAYPSIVGSGPNSTTLHYNRNDRFMQDGELLLMDMAASYGAYTADITRTVPVNGRFTEDQRAVYEIVLEALVHAEGQVRAGAPWKQPSDSATAVIQRGLARLGLIEAPNATYGCGSEERPQRCPQVALYYMHSLSHGIGLDVHDPDVSAQTGMMTPGSAFTIEPGIYVRAGTVEIIPATRENAAFRARIAPAVRRYANIGVRIEDDYLITDAGVERISAGAPREVEEVERAMATRRRSAVRDTAMARARGSLRPDGATR